MSFIPALAELELTLPDKDTGKPPTPSRLSSAATMRTLYTDMIREDEKSALTRVRVDAMVDGEPPFNQAALVASGQGTRANFNSLAGRERIARLASGYNDIITSAKTLMTIEVEGGEPNERLNYSRIISTELTRTIRKWESFMPNFLLLVELFVKHGVAIEYPPDPVDFRFDVCGFGEFLIPRQTKASAEKVPYAIARKDMGVTELYDSIRNPEIAKNMGWNVAVVNAAIQKATTAGSLGGIGNVENLQAQIKNNDIGNAKKFSHIAVLHGWVREFDGTLSFFICEKDNAEGDFLFKQYSRYTSVSEAFNFYTYGVGNGTFHSIRGAGNMIFALVQLMNRVLCQKADSVMLEGSVMLQATSSNAMQNATLNYMGPFSMLSEGFEVVDRMMSRSSDSAMPFLGEIRGMISQNSSQFEATPQQGQAYQNKQSVDAQLEVAAGGDSGSVDLFYPAWDRTMRRMCRRIIQGSKSDPLVAEFHRRVERAGITPEILASVDHDSTYSYRALGAGSPAARSIGFKRLLELLPQLDEIGRKNLIYQFVADIVGFQNVDVFASEAEEPRFNSEAGIATLENFAIMQGGDIPVYSYQMHATHVQIHLPPLIQTLESIDRGEIDPLQVLEGLKASLTHISAHGDQLAQDPTQAPLYGQVREAVNNLGQVVGNMEKKIKAAEKKANEAGAGAAEGSPDAAAASQMKLEELKVAVAEFKLQAAQEIHSLKMSGEQSKIDQSLALNDVKGAELAKKALRFPGTSFNERR